MFASGPKYRLEAEAQVYAQLEVCGKAQVICCDEKCAHANTSILVTETKDL